MLFQVVMVKSTGIVHVIQISSSLPKYLRWFCFKMIPPVDPMCSTVSSVLHLNLDSAVIISMLMKKSPTVTVDLFFKLRTAHKL